jgi:putative copper resistance protein D
MTPILGERFYRSLQLPWHTDLSGDQHLGGSIAWAAGEIPLVVVMMALLIQWRRSDQRTAVRQDRAAGRDRGADLTAYNAMLAELASRDK